MKPREFTKMSGAGNDFIVLRGSAKDVDANWVRRVCQRRRSVGSDGVVFVDPLPAKGEVVVVTVRFFNPDGSRAFCGNGSRCAARFALLEGMAPARMTLDTDVGAVPARVDAAGEVSLVLPIPADRGEIELDPAAGEGIPRRWQWIDSGVPHAIRRVEQVEQIPLEDWAPPVRSHPVWGAPGANVNVVSILRPGRIALRTFERGVEGETLACGSAAVAAAWWLRDSAVEGSIEVIPTGGTSLRVDVRQASSVTLIGDAVPIFRGSLVD